MTDASSPETGWQRVRKKWGERAGKMAGNIAAGVAEKNLNVQPDEIRESGFWSKFLSTAAETTALNIAEHDDVVAAIELRGTELVGEQIGEVKEEIIENTKPLLEKAASTLDPEKKSTYEVMRSKIASPDDHLIKRMLKSAAARLLSFGTTVGSYVAASLVDQLTGRDEWKENSDSFSRIVTGLVQKMPDRTGTATTA